MSAPFGQLAIIAGEGSLPALLAERYPGALMIRLNESRSASVGHIGDMLKRLRAMGVDRLCLIGAMKRPSWVSLWPSWETWKLICRYQFSFKGGDDRLLRRLRALLESEGFEVVGMRTLCPDLLMPVTGAVEGLHYMEEAHAIAAEDTGQACVFADGVLIDREDRAGTDALILRNAGKNAVLVKVAKPQQDLDLDMPVIGPRTVENCGKAGYRAIIVEAGKTMLVEREQCEILAQRYNIQLIGAA